MMRNQVLWKNPYAQPIITFEESDGERDRVTVPHRVIYSKSKDFSQDSRLSKGMYVWSGDLIKGDGTQMAIVISSGHIRDLMFLRNITGDEVTEV